MNNTKPSDDQFSDKPKKSWSKPKVEKIVSVSQTQGGFNNAGFESGATYNIMS